MFQIRWRHFNFFSTKFKFRASRFLLQFPFAVYNLRSKLSDENLGQQETERRGKRRGAKLASQLATKLPLRMLLLMIIMMLGMMEMMTMIKCPEATDLCAPPIAGTRDKGCGTRRPFNCTD